MTSKKRTFKDKLVDKYRLVILNDNTFEEKVSLNLTRLNVFVLVGFSIITLITLTALLIAFTPLREYIPGYSSTKLKKKALYLTEKTDSLTIALQLNKKQLASIRGILTGDILPSETIVDTLQNVTSEEKFDAIPTSKEDSILRAEVERTDKYNFSPNNKNRTNFVLFPPVQGHISENFNSKIKHYAIDIVVSKNTPVKAVADGTVIFSEWTVTTGYVIILEHGNNLLSVYKHNSSLNKTQGDVVKSGEVISFSGDTGELTTGPHLHFELWSDGYALNPTDFIDFNAINN